MQRRHFLTTAIGGGTAILMTGGTVGVWAQRRITPALPAVDPVAAHIERELTRLASDLRVGTRPHETITALASTFRLHAAHVRATQSDTTLATALAAQIRRQGRDGLLDAVSGPNARQMHRDMLHAHGLDSLQVDESDISRERANDVLNGLLAGTTLTTVLDQAAALYDTLARQVAHNEVSHNGPVVRAVQQCDTCPIQQPPDPGPNNDPLPRCEALKAVCNTLRVAAAICCALGIVPACAILGVEAATACALVWASGCP